VNEAAFSIRWAPAAQRDLRRLPEKIGTAVVEFIYGSLAGNPERVGRELHFQLTGHHAARRGDYRVVYRIDRRAGVVLIVHVGHRADVYRKS
jgi:mRNA interferase RelE/StbE